MFHSQHNIEHYLNHFFPEPGFFLEIGCWDGELISQTAWLERERGWTGVCVDPFPRNFQDRTAMVIPFAISKTAGEREFVKVSIDRRHGGDVSYFSGFRENIETHWDLIREHCNYKVVSVHTLTFDMLVSIYDLPHYIDFLSVDTEGSELEIFESIDFDVNTFGMIVFEHNENADVKRRIGELLASHGYECIAQMRCDDVYINGRLR